MREYDSLKHGRTRVDHEISFEHHRVMEGMPGERHSLAPAPEGLSRRLRRYTSRIRSVLTPTRVRKTPPLDK